MLTCRVNLVVALIFLFLGEVRSGDDLRYLQYSLEPVHMPRQPCGRLYLPLSWRGEK
jgi:hypothetical protein